MTLPAATGSKTFSESLMNSYSAALLACYDWATGPVFSCQVTDEWNGYILHTSNTLYYNLTRHDGSITIEVNGVTVKTINSGGAQTGTVDLTAQSLTVGRVYTLDVNGDYTMWWIGEIKTINYTPPPTFTDGVVLTAANLNTLRTCILECQSALDWPLPPCPIRRVSEKIHGSNDKKTVYKFSFKHVHDTLRYRFKHHAGGGCSANTTIYLNNTLILQKGERSTGQDWVTGTVNISSLGLTKGVEYYGYVTVQLNGTTDLEHIECTVTQITEESSVVCTPPPIWAHGGTNISAANLTKYGTIIDSIHPGAASPTLPLYYAQTGIPAASDSHEFYIQHHRRWLRYVANPGKTVTIKHGPNFKTKVDLPGGSGNLSYDLGQIPGLVVGQWYTIDDVFYAQEWTSTQP